MSFIQNYKNLSNIKSFLSHLCLGDSPGYFLMVYFMTGTIWNMLLTTDLYINTWYPPFQSHYLMQEERYGTSNSGPTLTSWVQEQQKRNPGKILSVVVIDLEKYYK